MSTQFGEMQDMADFVAQAIHRRAVGPDDPEGWIDLTEDERNEFRLIAHAAMASFGAWLATHDLVIAKVERKPAHALALPEKPKLILPGMH